MNKSLYILIFLLGALNVVAQDTLIYKGGKIKPVRIVAIDNSLKLIKYEVDSKIFIVDQNSIWEYKLHSLLEETNVIETSVNNRVIKGGRPKVPCKYSYSRLSFGLSPFPLLRNVNRDMSGIKNSYVSVFGEYLSKNRQFGVRVPIKIGLNNEITYGSFGSYYYNPYSYYGAKLKFEAGAQGIYNIPKKAKRIFSYVGMGLFIGKIQVQDYERYDSTSYDSNGNYLDYTIISEKLTEQNYNYFRFNLTYGLQFNITKSLNFGIENGLSFYGKEQFYGENRIYSKDRYYPNEFHLYSSGYYNFSFTQNSRAGIKYNFAIHLIYRLGGKKREVN